MIHLYLKALGAKSLEEIINIAQQEHDYLIHNNTNVCSPFYEFDLKYYTTMMESMSILNQSFHQKKFITSFETIFSFLVNPIIAFYNPAKGSLKFRCFCTGIIRSAPWSTCINVALNNHFNLAPNISNLVTIGCGSIYQTFEKLIESDKASISSTFLQCFISFVEFFLINYSSFHLSNILSKKIKFVPKWLINFLISLLYTAPMTRHFTTKGLKSLCYSIFFRLAERKSNNIDYDLPDDCIVPNELKCLICYDLVNDPVQCQGQIMCKSCLKRWIDSSHSYQNPITGKDFSPDEVSKEFVFDILSRKYAKYVNGSK